MSVILSLKVADNGDRLECYAKASDDDQITVEYYLNDIIQHVMVHPRETPLITVFKEIQDTFAWVV